MRSVKTCLHFCTVIVFVWVCLIAIKRQYIYNLRWMGSSWISRKCDVICHDFNWIFTYTDTNLSMIPEISRSPRWCTTVQIPSFFGTWTRLVVELLLVTHALALVFQWNCKSSKGNRNRLNKQSRLIGSKNKHHSIRFSDSH